MDFSQAYIQSDFPKSEWVYMRASRSVLDNLPRGTAFDPSDPPFILVKCALYGMPQSSHLWNATLHDYLIKDGFVRANSDACIYIKREGASFIILGC